MDKDVKKRKEQLLNELDEIEKECHLLLESIITFRFDLSSVQTKEQAVEFDETHDLENGLKHISLF